MTEPRPEDPTGSPPPSVQRGPDVSTIVFGVLLLLLGVGWLLQALTEVEFPWAALAPVGLIGVGVALVAVSRRQRPRGLLALGVVLLVLSAVAASNTEVLGDHLVRPTRPQDLYPIPDVLVGELTVDLRSFPLGDRTRINPLEEVRVGIGQLRVLVPEEMAVHIEARSGIGEVRVLGESDEGFGSEVIYEDSGFSSSRHRLTVELSVGIGEVSVER